jgi:uncharacterized phage protein (TIGR02220 family)
MDLILFIIDLRKKGGLYYQTWMKLLIQYNGENGQSIKLSVTPNVPKSTYYRIIQYGLDIFPKYIKNHYLVKRRNEIIIMFSETEQPVKLEKSVILSKVKKPRQPQVKPITNNDLILEIINFLNECTGKSYKPTSKVATININARLKEGYTKDDFIKVISVKSSKWLGTKFEDYLTPNTLFGNKFESYLNENINVEKTKQQNAYEQVIKATELGFNDK